MPPVIQLIMGIIVAAGNVGVWSAVGFVAKWYWDRRRWMRYMDDLRRLSPIHEIVADNLDVTDWEALGGWLLNKNSFSPSEIMKYLQLAARIAQSDVFYRFRDVQAHFNKENLDDRPAEH